MAGEVEQATNAAVNGAKNVGGSLMRALPKIGIVSLALIFAAATLGGGSVALAAPIAAGKSIGAVDVGNAVLEGGKELVGAIGGALGHAGAGAGAHQALTPLDDLVYNPGN